MKDLLESRKEIDEIDDSKIAEYNHKFNNFVNDDMNMPGAMGIVWEVIKSPQKSHKLAELLLKFDEVLGLDLKNSKKYLEKFQKSKTEDLPEEIKQLVEERKQARENKDWAKSDELRDLITSKGYSIKDTKDGIIVKKEI